MNIHQYILHEQFYRCKTYLFLCSCQVHRPFLFNVKQIQSLTLLPRAWLANTWHLPTHPQGIMITDHDSERANAALYTVTKVSMKEALAPKQAPQPPVEKVIFTYIYLQKKKPSRIKRNYSWGSSLMDWSSFLSFYFASLPLPIFPQ